MKLNGDARSENTGSVNTVMPPSCANIVAWPIQVMAGCMAVRALAFAEIKARSGAMRGVGVCGGLGRPSRAAANCQRRKSAKPLVVNSL